MHSRGWWRPFVTLLVTVVGAAVPAVPAAEPPPVAQAAQGASSPAEAAIVAAREAIEKNSNRADAHNALAMALARRARETSDTSYYEQAQHALDAALRLEPDNLESQKTRVWILLGRHKFSEAREVAEAIIQRAPDDVQAYGLFADAHVGLGSYDEAEIATQTMLDLHPGSVPGLTRGAYLRELYGDLEGALEFMSDAYQRLPPNEVEDRAWVLTHAAHLELSRGNVGAADSLLDEADELFPNYHYALAQRAKVRVAQGRHAEAAGLLRRHVNAAPHPENFYYLAEALHRAGQEQAAKDAFEEFEQKARAEMEGHDNANRELIFYYADHADRPDEALRLARQEIAWRQDVQTLDAYAWALHRAGRHAEALEQIQKALAVGVRDATMLYHAGKIAAAASKQAMAEQYLKRSLEANPHSDIAAAARMALDRPTAPTTLPAETAPAADLSSPADP